MITIYLQYSELYVFYSAYESRVDVKAYYYYYWSDQSFVSRRYKFHNSEMMNQAEKNV